ncbi:MFS transporter ACS family allantoate permease [Penicillium lagena]|uniref:MFS transporter ACS family allantoate permease n=1 Tax=Penicillium lagena TaxID=94218 RepID=UPI0025406E66|nr:MFS transporter ACS family allantoate permease [Penicillium lagena]KAJ5624269.1 MFS transporter ACS family allantoate permease [Penicillium lagena]
MAAPLDNQASVQDPVPAKEIVVEEGDIALQFAGDVTEVSPELISRVRWKVDLFVLPLLALTTLLQFLDKSTLSYAGIFGILEDLTLSGEEYSWLASIFYFGYFAMQPIGSYLLQKFAPAKCLAASVFCWGIILFMHVICKNWAGLMAVRFFLGMAEGVVTPAFMLISTGWYARQDQPLRMGFWFSFNGIAQIVGGLLAYGLGHIHVNNIAPWKWMFIITAALSIIWSIVLFLALPDSQLTAWFLKDDAEKHAAIEMVRENNTGIHSRKFKKKQAMEALCDPKAWMLFLMALVWNIPNSVATFGNLLVENFGYSTLETTLLGMPAGALEFVIMLIITYVCISFNNTRVYCMTVALVLALVGSVMVYAAPYDNKGALLAGYYLIYVFPTGYILLLSLASANIAGHTKKVTVNAMLLIGIAGPQFFKNKQAPRYGLGIGACLCSFAILIVLVLVMGFYLNWQNKRRQSDRSTSEAAVENVEFFDLTDETNPGFVYVY